MGTGNIGQTAVGERTRGEISGLRGLRGVASTQLENTGNGQIPLSFDAKLFSD